MIKRSDDAMLDAYNAGLERAAVLLKQMYGCDDVKQATPEQLRDVASALLAEIGRDLAAEGVSLTPKQIMADHRKLTRLKRKAAN